MVLDLRKPHHCCPRVDYRCKLLEHQFNGTSVVRRQDRLGCPLEDCTLLVVEIRRPHACWFITSEEEVLECQGNGATDGASLQENLFVDVHEDLLTDG